MEAVAVFSVVAATFQVIDCGSRFIKLVYQLYRSEADVPQLMSDSERLTSILEDGLKSLQSSNDPVDQTRGQDGSLAQLASECQVIAEELLEYLRPMLSMHSPHRKRDAIRVALQATLKQEKIKSLESRLRSYRDQLSFHLLASIQHFVVQSLHKQEETLQKLGVASQQTSRLEGSGTSILDFLVSKSAAEENKSDLKADLRDDLVTRLYNEHERSANTIAQAIELTSTTRHKLQQSILALLKYSGMQEREARIAATYESTFEWVFRDSQSQTKTWHNLARWLADDGGDRFYWCTGKPGSGKSTLMKFLCHSDSNSSEDGKHKLIDKPGRRCLPYLEKWAGNKKLLVASFYFWMSGTDLQSAWTGLLRSLLYQILVVNADLIPIGLPFRWESFSILGWQPSDWNESELQSAVELSVKALTADTKICFFIDGLDEFSGDYDQLIELVKSLVERNSNVKFCVASRPWVNFETAFNEKPHLRLEDLTYNDIKHFVSGKFQLNPDFQNLLLREPDFADLLITNIVEKARGVFLWVDLVVTSLLSGLHHGDRVRDLQERLDELPPELERLYDSMLRSLDPRHREDAAQYVMLMEASDRPLPLLVFYFADEQDAESAKKMTKESIPDDILSLNLDNMSRRLKSRWKGLLEIEGAVSTDDTATKANSTVQYLHKTVKDFVQGENVKDFLLSSLTSPFDPHLSLCIGWSSYIKASTLNGVDATDLKPCFHHANRISSSSENDMVQILDSLAVTLPYVTDLANSLFPFRDDGLTHDIESANPFLSIVVLSGVTAYVKERAMGKCSTMRPGRGKAENAVEHLPLLMFAVKSIENRYEMVECLLRLGADPNEQVAILGGETFGHITPWVAFLTLTRMNINFFRKFDSFAVMDADSQRIILAMVRNGANLNDKHFTSFLAGRSRMGILREIFTKNFVKELAQIQATSKKKESGKWYARFWRT